MHVYVNGCARASVHANGGLWNLCRWNSFHMHACTNAQALACACVYACRNGCHALFRCMHMPRVHPRNTAHACPCRSHATSSGPLALRHSLPPSSHPPKCGRCGQNVNSQWSRSCRLTTAHHRHPHQVPATGMCWAPWLQKGQMVILMIDPMLIAESKTMH